MASPDTSPEAAGAQRDAWRRMAGAERALLALEMSDQLLAVALAAQAQRHPGSSPAEQRRALIRHMHRIDVPAARVR